MLLPWLRYRPEEVEGADDLEQLEEAEGLDGAEYLGVVVHLGDPIVLAYLQDGVGKVSSE